MPSSIAEILKINLTVGLDFDILPSNPGRNHNIPHAPNRSLKFSDQTVNKKLAIKNVLRYFPEKFHKELAIEFKNELENYGHIYCYRFRPTAYKMQAYSLESYPGNSLRAKAIMLMIMNNLDHSVAQFPDELITYGGNGGVFSNWAQYCLVMKYLSTMTDDQTLVMYSGHPLGLFPSTTNSPVCIITNGLMVPRFSSLDDYTEGYALGVTQYGQMTAGSYCYIGPQGIVHGTTITIKNAGRKYLNVEDMSGKVFVSSGLGGMSGAQPKAGDIVGCISVIAEVYEPAIIKRKNQGWVKEIIYDLDQVVERVRVARSKKESTSIAYHGNIVDLWERFAKEEELLVDLGSDQTSCHIPYTGGYYPVGKSWDESNQIMQNEPEAFKKLVNDSLRRQFEAIQKLVAKGMSFFDYGNSFLNSCSQAGIQEIKNKNNKINREFIFPSYVQDIMGDVFSLGFGPFRWVCTSGDDKDLNVTDNISKKVIEDLMLYADEKVKQQLSDNHLWISKAEENKLVVGSKARILYSDTVGRMQIALAFNRAIRNGEISAPVVLSRDHHDVSGADSPFRETSNIYDGSFRTADMSTHTAIGNAQRGASWVALHNGGGTGWGNAQNCGFGLLLDGREETDNIVKDMIFWDVANGLARRQWSYHPDSRSVIQKLMEKEKRLKVTVSVEADDSILDEILS